MKKVYTVAHTHWDYEWYFTRQEARAQFIFHMDEVLQALEENQLDFYTLDGQMSIIEEYLAVCPENKERIIKFVKAGRLFIGPWFTQIDEMTTSGESIVRNLRLGIQQAEALGGAMRVGYLPDSFGQSQDMPKIYQGFNINHALFWRGMPRDAKTRYFYWTSEDGSKVLTANIKNGYYAGVDLIEQNNFNELVDRISTDTDSQAHLLPVGGDQRAVDFNLKERVIKGNIESEEAVEFIESNYPSFFQALSKEQNLSELSGEFIDPSDSKIHRGIYSSRYDLKQIYDRLERLLTYQLEPLSVIAKEYGLPIKQNLINSLWATVARGQAHDSAGGCNSDKTNQDIYMRGVNAIQETQSTLDYLLRKLSMAINQNEMNDLFVWNPLPFEMEEVRELVVSTQVADFTIEDSQGNQMAFDVIEQQIANDALLRRNTAERLDESYYVTRIAINCDLPSMGYRLYRVVEGVATGNILEKTELIENETYQLEFKDGVFNLYGKQFGKWFSDFLRVEDGGDEGDTYDYSPAYDDWLLDLDFSEADVVTVESGDLKGQITVEGVWALPFNLESRQAKKLDGRVAYRLVVSLNAGSPSIDVNLTLDNQVLDHRLRLKIMTDVQGSHSYADTPFGMIERPVEDASLHNWREIGYKEEPTSMRPMLHLANLHNDQESWTFLTKGSKDFQIIGDTFNVLAVTIFRGVGFLGRPDTLRRPGDASGLHMRELPTPDSQLVGQLTFEGSIVLDSMFNPQQLQKKYLKLTQENMYYQTQVLNRFTTPIQYFPVNTLPAVDDHQNRVTLQDETVVLSSLLPTIDGSGIELRVYNPSKQPLTENVGTLILSNPADILLLDLEGKVCDSISSNSQKVLLTPFKPGEIRTYGIYFK